MLCLSRYPGQSIIIFDKNENPVAEIRINGLKGEQVSVGIQATREFDIVRSELKSFPELEDARSRLK